MSAAAVEELPHRPLAEPEDSVGLPRLDGDEVEATTEATPLLSPRHYDVPPFGWRPLYLRRRVMTVFLLIFLVLTGAIHGIGRISEQQGGIITANKTMYYLWMFGPTMIISILLSSWGRVELQALRYAPWIRLSRGEKDSHDAAHTLLVDYHRLFRPNAALVALMNGDYLVCTSMIISLILYAQLFLSTSLIILEPRAFQQHVALTVQDSFTQEANSNGDLAQWAPFVVMNGMLTLNLTIPTAYIPGYAFQNFTLAAREAAEDYRNFTGVMETALVDMQCEGSTLQKQPYSGGYALFFEGTPCRSRRYDIGLQQQNDPRVLPQGMSYFWIYDDVTVCLPANRSIILAAVVAVNRSGNDMSYVMSSQIMCEASLALGRASVTYEVGLQPVLEPIKTSNHTLLDTNLGKEMSRYRADQRGLGRDSWENTDADYASQLALNPFRVGIGLLPTGAPNVSQLLDDATLAKIITLWTERFGSLLAHFHHRKSEPINTSGTASVQRDRLVVDIWFQKIILISFYFMVGLSGIMILQSPKQGFIPRDPDTISGSVALLSESRDLLDKLHTTGSEDMSVVAEYLLGTYRTVFRQYMDDPRKPSFFLREDDVEDNDNEAPTRNNYKGDEDMRYYPWSLLLWVRWAVLFTLVVVAGLFIYILNEPTYRDGFRGGNDNHWRELPIVVLASLTLYLRACDFSVRFMAPFHVLKRRQTFSKSLAVSYTDLIGVWILVRSFRHKNWTVFVSKTLSIVCPLLPILSNDLLVAETRDISAQTQLQQQTWFASEDFRAFSWQSPAIVGDLLLINEKNLDVSFPPWTYEEFAFHTQRIVDNDQDLSSAVNVSVHGTVPAVKMDLDCSLRTTRGPLSTGVEFDFDGRRLYCFYGFDCSKYKYFGGVIGGGSLESVCNSPNTPVTNYVWGSCNNGHIDYLAVLSCGEEAVEVDFHASFHGPDLQLDTVTNPPVPLPNSSRSYPFRGHVKDLYSMLEPLVPFPFFDVSNGYLCRFFKTLVSSRYSIPIAYLGSNATSDYVIAAIKKQHGIIRAQTLTFGSNDSLANTPPIRKSFMDSKLVPSGFFTPWERPKPTNATLRTTQSRLVIRNNTAKVALWILSAVIVLDIISIYITPQDRLYKSPGSIAAMASLVVDSTIFKHLPEGAEWMTDEVLERHFEGKSFRAGKFHVFHRRNDDEGSAERRMKRLLIERRI
ncbi:hypothetical protein B0J13DRAFT_531084 [Dactylonectria estremocensis]|uniref:Uncharacterized protein n=1 Tax=Dactylonectria estremocensis TaxID=1079267 RepID=A0A9P9DVL4_9HYPO|nr:hypothetical protein B0J13DRAFT_531084 [Dactylonectria estremocensis]